MPPSLASLSAHARRIARWGRAALMGWSLGLGGCVTLYQPLSGLQTPIAVDPSESNFPGLRLLVRCLEGDFSTANASRLCRVVEQSFSNQGALVTVVAKDEELKTELDAANVEADAADTTQDVLFLELQAKKVADNTDTLSWTFSFLTLTLFPAKSEYVFVQEVAVRNQQGTRLATAELKGRVIRRFGLGYWSINGIANLLGRNDEQDQNDRGFRTRLSSDVLGQLSQIVFNARLRQSILAELPAPPRLEPAP